MDTCDTGVRPMVRQSLKQQWRVQKVGAIRAMVMVEECVDVPPGAKPEWDDSKDALLASWEEGQSLHHNCSLWQGTPTHSSWLSRSI